MYVFFTFQQSFHRVTTHAQATAHNYVHVYNPSPVTASVPSLVHVVKLAFQPKAFDKPVYRHTKAGEPTQRVGSSASPIKQLLLHTKIVNFHICTFTVTTTNLHTTAKDAYPARHSSMHQVISTLLTVAEDPVSNDTLLTLILTHTANSTDGIPCTSHD